MSDLVFLDETGVLGKAACSARASTGPVRNPIEFIFAKVKATLCKTRAQTLEALTVALTSALQLISSQDVQACFKHCGYF